MRRLAFHRCNRVFALVLIVMMSIAPGGASQFPRRISAETNHIGTQITQIMAGANGDSTVQYIEMGFGGCGQNSWKGFGSASAAILVFYDAAGNETFRYKFPNDPPCGNDHVLIATQGFVTLTGLTPEFIIPAKVSPISGKVCFKGNTAEAGSFAFFRNHCVSYGSFTGDTETNVDGFGNSVSAGTPAPALPIVGTSVLKLTGNAAVETNAQFTIAAAAPENHLSQTTTIPTLTQVQVGENLFNKETFGGNGRTCASCHVSGLGLGLTPSNIQTRFATLATGTSTDFSDPLFLGESNMNLNTLIVTNPASDNSQGSGRGIRDFEGIITGSGGGRARIVTKLVAQGGGQPLRYLVYGGLSPVLAGTISDSFGNTATLSSITAGTLACSVGTPTCVNQLENPTKMRTSVDTTNFPQGRGLILENIDGFTNPHSSNHVFRKSPNLDNAKLTAPFGLSGLVGGASTLGEFATGAVKQHFPRTIDRVEGVDFRLPTTDEKAAMNAFQQSVNVPADENFSLDLFATTAAQIAGRTAFFSSTAKCSKCHSGSVLANTDGTIAGKPGNANFDTNVDGMPINAGGDLLPNEASGTREFNTPALFNVRNHAPFFHNGAAATVKQAVEFYTSPAFQSSPAVSEIGGIITITNATELDNIVAFLEGLAVRPYSRTAGPLSFGSQNIAAGQTATQQVTITNTSSAPLTLTSPFVRITGTDSSQFVITTHNLTATLGVGNSATANIAFDPSTAGAKTAIVELLAAIPSGVAISGTATSSAPGITVTPTSGLVTTETGGTATYTMSLNSQPTANVSIGVSSSDTTEAVVSPSVVVFTPANFSTPQTVTVTGVNDFTLDGNVGYTIINAAATSTDVNYNGLNPSDVTGSTTDNGGVAGIIVTPTSGLFTTQTGVTANFTAVLASPPVANVTFSVTSSDITEGIPSTSSLTFTPANWFTPQPVTITGVNDGLTGMPVAYTILTGAASSADGNYNGKNPSDVSITNYKTAMAQVITDLRTAVNAKRAQAGLSAAVFTDPTLNNTIKVKAVHITELRTALDAARSILGQSTGGYTDPTLTVGTTQVKAIHIQELKNRL